MPITVPPPPLPKEEYEKRIRNGAKTFQEIDPEFHQWLKQSQMRRCIMTCTIVIAITLLTLFFLFKNINE